MLKKLEQRYGRLAGAQYGLSCQQNALYNGSLAIMIDMPVQILYLNTVELAHAYLTDGQRAYSAGLTWRNDELPEYTIRELNLLNAEDITMRLLMSALSYQNGIHNAFTVVLQKLEKSIPGITAQVQNYAALYPNQFK